MAALRRPARPGWPGYPGPPTGRIPRSVDYVVLHLALAVVPDPVAAIREAARVLWPEGRVAVFDRFLPDGVRPSVGRRLPAAVARVIATDLNRQLGLLLAAAGLREIAREPVGLGGRFVVARAEGRPLGGD
jgi:phosphatidylethanolamine/phosphatidyl-N-methylethanolamine N-methyltransferase